ncbi:DNA phosphorothioation-dependent restriction protein DptF [Psychromonas sp. psych-6C06]|nr:DNA phosphorothioation-dependent restriction protein DptF [Psychromonas sp. psych-6C06]
MDFRTALSVMSKSSPYAVSTERSTVLSTDLDAVKKYLYIEDSDIETDFKKVLNSLSFNDKKIIFLCGSSGDGKSEILTRAKKNFLSKVNFHLDATHSFHPNDSAIQTLDKLFLEFSENSKPLVVGINTGMLGNYAKEGAVSEIKKSALAFLDKESTPDNHIFLDFESYPKFKITDDGYEADFTHKLLNKITQAEGNLIREIYERNRSVNKDKSSKRLHANYELLSQPAVQKTIVELLFKARLMHDQFLTARSLLDFIFTLLAGPGYLFDNLFAGGDNELLSKITDFDPAHLRTQKIDRFILANDLALPDNEFDEFKAHIESIGIENLTGSHSYLRLFYVLKNGDFKNTYPSKFIQDFNESLIEKYINIYQLHRSYDGSSIQRKALKDFYKNSLSTAIRKYNNRNAPNLGKSHYLISELNGYQLAAELDITADIKRITQFSTQSPASFTACIKVENELLSIPVNINLLNLMQKIVDGYRPNKHDKNTVVLLDELIAGIVKVANKLNTLHIFKSNQHITVKKVDEDELKVSGM